MIEDAGARLLAEVQAAPVALQPVHDAQALLIVAEAGFIDLVQCALARVAERRMAEIVAEGDRLGEILVQLQRTRDGARDARDLQRVGQARAVVVALRLEEDLGLMFQAAEGF